MMYVRPASHPTAEDDENSVQQFGISGRAEKPPDVRAMSTFPKTPKRADAGDDVDCARAGVANRAAAMMRQRAERVCFIGVVISAPH